MKFIRNSALITGTLLTLLLLTACAGALFSPEKQCEQGLTEVYEDLEKTTADKPRAKVALVKAATFLAAAKVKQQLELYESCVEKLNSARAYIKEAHDY